MSLSVSICFVNYLFHNEVNDLARDKDFFDESLALYEGGDTLVGSCCCQGGIFVGIAGDLDCGADFSIDLYADFDQIIHGLGRVRQSGTLPPRLRGRSHRALL